jgi:outer membrane lipoprotein-sorting protein
MSLKELTNVRFTRNVAAMTLLLAFAATSAMAAPDLKELASPIHDFSATVNATQVNIDELVKISKDYANTYRIQTTRVFYKSPNHVRVTGSVGPLGVDMVINGNTKKVKFGPIHHTDDLTDKPGQKSGLMDFGVITADQLEDYTWKFIRQEGADKAPLLVYELRFKNIKEDPSRRLIWVDPIHKVMVRRQTYQQFHDNSLKMTLKFDGLKEVSAGVWVPTIVKVYNSEGKLGAISKETGIKVNNNMPIQTFDM